MPANNASPSLPRPTSPASPHRKVLLYDTSTAKFSYDRVPTAYMNSLPAQAAQYGGNVQMFTIPRYIRTMELGLDAFLMEPLEGEGMTATVKLPRRVVLMRLVGWYRILCVVKGGSASTSDAQGQSPVELPFVDSHSNSELIYA